jgi:flagellin
VAITIGSNSASLRALRSLASASDGLARSYERLSSGQRINRASDDAAGVSIADRLRSDAALQSQAIRNINDGISALSIADATLQSQVSVIQRMNELAAQAANGTYSSEQRDALSKEFIELRSELGRIAESATFNGQQLLSTRNAIGGSRMSLQLGINGSRDALLELPSMSSGALTGNIGSL